jgi:hypothetical protein
MNPQNRKPSSIVDQPVQLDSGSVQVLLDNQRIGLQNEAAKIRVQERQIDADLEFAKESLRRQAEYMNNQQAETRKTISLVAGIFGGFTVLLMAFVIYCLYVGERDFITTVLKGLSYLATTGLGYYFGQRNKVLQKEKTSSDSPSAEVIND